MNILLLLFYFLVLVLLLVVVVGLILLSVLIVLIVHPKRVALARGGELGLAIPLGKGQLGSALMGPLHFRVFWRRDFSGTPVKPTFIFPKVPGRTFFPIRQKSIVFAAAPLVLTPFVRNQILRATAWLSLRFAVLSTCQCVASIDGKVNFRTINFPHLPWNMCLLILKCWEDS